MTRDFSIEKTPRQVFCLPFYDLFFPDPVVHHQAYNPDSRRHSQVYLSTSVRVVDENRSCSDDQWASSIPYVAMYLPLQTIAVFQRRKYQRLWYKPSHRCGTHRKAAAKQTFVLIQSQWEKVQMILQESSMNPWQQCIWLIKFLSSRMR